MGCLLFEEEDEENNNRIFHMSCWEEMAENRIEKKDRLKREREKRKKNSYDIRII